MFPRHPDTLRFLDREQRLLINGEWVQASDGELLDTVNPATGRSLARCASAGPEDIDRAVAAARHAFESGPWPGMGPSARSRLLWALAEAIDRHAETLTELEILDNGMPLDPAARLAAPGAAKMFRYYAGWPGKITGRTLPSDTRPEQARAPLTYTRREPVGVAGQIIPWNYPLGMAAMKLGPALAAGCTVVLKPDEHTPLSALFLGELIGELGFPPGVINILPGTGERAGAALASHPGVDKIAFTGSTATGRAIIHAAAGNLKRVSLELGGKSPFIVFPDANLDRVVAAASRLGFFLQGQNCQCPSRIYVHDKVYDTVVERLLAAIATMPVGPGWDPANRIGPLISAEQRARVEDYIASGIADGATVLTGGGRPDSDGYFLQPTLFADTDQQMRIMREEIFGPVLCVQRFTDASPESVARLANATDYGLVASVWTSDLSTAHALAESIRAGVVGINHHGGGDVFAPFGGYKASGWHREFGAESLDAYLETKTVVTSFG